MRQLKREVKIGNVTIGGNNPIAVQTMLNVPVEDIADLHFSFQLPHPVVPLSVIQLR